MYQDSHFSADLAEEDSDFPQIPFPEPARPDTLQFPAYAQQSNVPDSPQLAFPSPLPPAATPGPLPFSTPSPFAAPQLSFPSPPPAASATSYDYMQKSFPQPLPSTETIDTAQIAFLRQMPATEAEHKAADGIQAHFPHQLTYGSAPSYPQMSEASMQGLFTTQMPAFVEIPIVTQPDSAPGTAQQPTPSKLPPSNQQAKRAIINGVISLIVSAFTFLTIAGFAGLVIGTFAIIYGFMGLRMAWQLPGKTGRGLALIGIVLGLLAWCIVIAASIFHAPLSS